MDVESQIRYLVRCCYWYYVRAQPLISDREYDRLFHELKEAEGAFPQSYSPTQMIYGDREEQYPEWAKTR